MCIDRLVSSATDLSVKLPNWYEKICRLLVCVSLNSSKKYPSKACLLIKFLWMEIFLLVICFRHLHVQIALYSPLSTPPFSSLLSLPPLSLPPSLSLRLQSNFISEVLPIFQWVLNELFFKSITTIDNCINRPIN